jgi:hypothetical protein
VKDPTDESTVSFDAVDWATHCAALSQYYLAENEFATARHCLACSDFLLTKMEKDRANLDEALVFRLDEQFAHINRCWSKYGIGLLAYSKEQLCNQSKSHMDLVTDFDKPSLFHFDLSKVNLTLDTVEKPGLITANMALDYDQAKKIFQKTLEFLELSKSYFKLDGHVTDHCEILRDISELYTQIMFYDENPENKSKYLKRKLDLLKPVAHELSENYYLAIKRQFLFDIAVIYSDMMDVKIEVLNQKRESASIDQTVIAQMIQKINLLTRNAIKYFQLFLNTMRVLPEKVKLPEKYDEFNVRSALLAHFYIGRLFSKFMTGDVSERLNNTKNSHEYYSYVVDYCEKYGDTCIEDNKLMDMMKVEYNICKEMISFMPVKMENLRKNIK